MKKNLLVFLYLFVIVVVLSELLLRYSGYKPGFVKSYKDFELVDSLILYDLYITDDQGIYKFNPQIISSYNNSTNTEYDSQYMTEGFSNTYKVFRHIKKQVLLGNSVFYGISNEDDTSNWNTEFPKSAKSEFDNIYPHKIWSKLFSEYLNYPYNLEGFRSIPFDTSQTERPKILLLGDSYVYGMSANPIFNCFSDILLSRRYIVYNTGIPGTDPAQYAAVSKKYVPLLKPDIVILNFFRDNDFMAFERETAKNKPHEHYTNVGFLESMPTGKYLSAEEAYQFYVNMIKIPNTEGNLFNHICSKSALLSTVWGVLHFFNLVEHKELTAYNEVNFGKSDIEKAKITNKYISEIHKVCESNSSTLLNVIIPKKFYPRIFGHHINYKPLKKDVLSALFGDLPFYYPNDLINTTDYEGGHFNNKGSLKYANYLDSLIKEHISAKQRTYIKPNNTVKQ
ncbi:MAG: hypothetical protein WD048_11790 [Chitinophagales bacterium]